jgi:hypothetical protein
LYAVFSESCVIKSPQTGGYPIPDDLREAENAAPNPYLPCDKVIRQDNPYLPCDKVIRQDNPYFGNQYYELIVDKLIEVMNEAQYRDKESIAAAVSFWEALGKFMSPSSNTAESSGNAKNLMVKLGLMKTTEEFSEEDTDFIPENVGTIQRLNSLNELHDIRGFDRVISIDALCVDQWLP